MLTITAAKASTTCGSVKSSYKEQGCCGNPSKAFKASSLQCTICAVGCAPYGMDKVDQWFKTAEAMGEQCDLMIHLGDVMGSGPTANNIECNASIMTPPIDQMMRQGKPLLFMPADNEVADCHRAAGNKNGVSYPVEFVKAEDSRNFWINRYFQDTTTDLTGTLPLTTQSAECPFNTYLEKCGAAVSTYEIPGSQFYLQDESHNYPTQDQADPIADRKAMYNRANDCALTWLEQSFQKANAAGLHTLFLFYHAAFWQMSGGFPKDFGAAMSTYGFGGDIHNADTLGMASPYEPVANKILELADMYPDLMVYNVISDWHFFHMQNPKRKKNLMLVMTEGDKEGIETFVKFKVDAAEGVMVQEVTI